MTEKLKWYLRLRGVWGAYCHDLVLGYGGTLLRWRRLSTQAYLLVSVHTCSCWFRGGAHRPFRRWHILSIWIVHLQKPVTSVVFVPKMIILLSFWPRFQVWLLKILYFGNAMYAVTPMLNGSRYCYYCYWLALTTQNESSQSMRDRIDRKEKVTHL